MGLIYDTEDEVNAAILKMKDDLDNKPTTYCRVERVTPNPDGTYLIEGVYLSDFGINNLAEDGHYSISSTIAGDSFVGLTKVEAEVKIEELKKIFATESAVNIVYTSDEYVPTIADMSVYIIG